VARGTATVVAKESRLPKYPLDISTGREHVKALANALASFGQPVREAIQTASDAGDADTADLFTDASRGIDKLLWFVEAHGQAKD
jgi:starvation-inducible DNA-binding protein